MGTTAAGGTSCATSGGAVAVAVPVSSLEGDAPTPAGRFRNSSRPSATSWLVPMPNAITTESAVTPSITRLARRRRRRLASCSVTGRVLRHRCSSLLGELVGEGYETGAEDRDQSHGRDGTCNPPAPGSPGRGPPAPHGRDTHDRQREADRDRVEKDGAQAEQQQQMEQHSPPNHVGQALDR